MFCCNQFIKETPINQLSCVLNLLCTFDGQLKNVIFPNMFSLKLDLPKDVTLIVTIFAQDSKDADKTDCFYIVGLFLSGLLCSFSKKWPKVSLTWHKTLKQVANYQHMYFIGPSWTPLLSHGGAVSQKSWESSSISNSLFHPLTNVDHALCLLEDSTKSDQNVVPCHCYLVPLVLKETF